MTPKTILPCLTWMILLLLIAIGCSLSDERLVALSRETCKRQAEQNTVIARQNLQITDMSNEFLVAEGQARKEMLEIQRELVGRDRQSQTAFQKERANLDRQREDLEGERREIARQTQRAPVIAAAITQVGLLLVCALPLVLCFYLLRTLHITSADDDAAVTQLLIEELVADQPRFLPAPGQVAAIAEELPSVPALPNESSSPEGADGGCAANS